MATIQHEDDRPPVVLAPPVDVDKFAEAVAARIRPFVPETAPEGFVGTSVVLEWLGWGAKGYDRLLLKVKAGEIPHYREGQRLYFRLSELSDWMARKRNGGE
jgi:hypothetical protein